MGVLEIISIGGMVLRAITLVQEIFDGTENTGEDKKAVVMSLATVALKKSIPDADDAKLAAATATIDEFVEAGVKLLKAVQK